METNWSHRANLLFFLSLWGFLVLTRTRISSREEHLAVDSYSMHREKGAMYISRPDNKAKTSHKNSKGHIEILAGHPSSPPPSLSSTLSQSALPLSYFCLLSAQSIPFRPRWLLLRRAAVGLTNNGRTETKASLLGWRVTERQTESERGMERERKTERKSGTQRSIVAGLTSGGHVWPEQQG